MQPGMRGGKDVSDHEHTGNVNRALPLYSTYHGFQVARVTISQKVAPVRKVLPTFTVKFNPYPLANLEFSQSAPTYLACVECGGNTARQDVSRYTPVPLSLVHTPYPAIPYESGHPPTEK